MKWMNRRVAWVAVAACLLALALWPAEAAADPAGAGSATADTASGTVNMGLATVPAGETRDSLNLGMGQAVIDGTVTGDATVNLGQAVVGPAGIVAGRLTVNTGAAVVNGRVGGSVTVSVGRAEIAPAADVGSVTISGRGRVLVNGTVEGNVDVAYGEVVLGAGSSVRGAVHVGEGRVVRNGGEVTGGVTVDRELSEAELGDALGDMGSSGRTYFLLGPLRIYVGPDGQVAWSTDRSPDGMMWPMHPARGDWAVWSLVGRLSWGLAMATALFLVGLLTVVLFPRAESGMVRGVLERPWRSLLAGFLTLVLALPAFLLLIVSIVGIPLAILLPFALVALFFTGEAVVFHALGQLMRERFWPDHTWHVLAELAAGAALAFLLVQVPILGALAAFLAAVVGAGALLLTRFGSWRPWFRGPGNGPSRPPAPDGEPRPTA